MVQNRSGLGEREHRGRERHGFDETSCVGRVGVTTVRWCSGVTRCRHNATAPQRVGNKLMKGPPVRRRQSESAVSSLYLGGQMLMRNKVFCPDTSVIRVVDHHQILDSLHRWFGQPPRVNQPRGDPNTKSIFTSIPKAMTSGIMAETIARDAAKYASLAAPRAEDPKRCAPSRSKSAQNRPHP